jgi:hypothetical protein
MRIVMAIMNLILLCAPAVIAGFVSARLARTSREEWVLLAWVPPLPLLAFGLYVGIVQARDPTAANLWPFVLVFCAAVTLALFALFLLARRLVESGHSRQPTGLGHRLARNRRGRSSRAGDGA